MNIVKHLFVTSNDLLIHVRFLLGIITTFLLVLALSFNNTFQSVFKVQLLQKLLIFRKYVLLFILLFLTTLVYLVVDTHIFALPDPIVLYGFYILGLTILLGTQVAVVASFVTVILIEYYIYEPRFRLFYIHHPINVLYIIFIIGLGLLIGRIIRRYQQGLIKKSEDLDLLIKARDQFSAIAVHELKTPLTTISLYSQSLNKQYKNRNASQALQNSIQTISHETEKLNYMINDLLDFSRFQTNKFNLNAEVFNLALLCRDRIKVAHSLYPDHEYIFKQYTRSSNIYADPVALDRVITNLLTNAGKYSEIGGKITVTLRKKHREFVLSVTDRGCGINQDHLYNLFEPFYQVENGKKGMGLGLYIAKSIVEVHKGKIWVESVEGKGSKFSFTLPVGGKT